MPMSDNFQYFDHQWVALAPVSPPHSSALILDIWSCPLA